MAVDPQLRDLARRMYVVERQARQRKLPTLAFSAIDDGAISAIDADGNITAIFGKQFDGTHAPAIVGGPTPPQPNMPFVEALSGALRIYWDGTFEGGAVAPMDFARVVVYATPLEDFVFANALDQTIVVGEMSSATGGEVSVNLTPGVEYAVFFVTWSLAGKYSAASDVAVETTGDAVGPTTDGLAPTESPQPDVLGGLGSFFLRWAPPVNADPLRYEVHVSPTSGFTPDVDTLYAETSATSMTVRDMPIIDTETGEPFPFSYDTTYYFRVIAKDEDGAAPAGAETGNVLVKVTSEDIAARSIIGENIAGETLTGDLFTGNLVLGSTISTGALDDDGNIIGARVELGPSGIMVIDASGEIIALFPLSADDDAYVRANFELMSAEVRDNFTMHGTNNSIAKDGALYLSEGVTAPTVALTPTYQYETVQLDTTTACVGHTRNPGYDLGSFALNPAQITSMVWDPEWNAWVVCQQKSGGVRIWRFTSTGAIYNNLATGRPWVDDYNDRTDSRIGPGKLVGGVPSSQAMLVKSSGAWYIWGYTPTGAPDINRIPASWIHHTDQAPALGFDAAANRYILVQNNGGGGGTLEFRRFYMVASSGGGFPNVAHTSTTQGPAGSATVQQINGMVYGTQVTNGGSSRYAVSFDNYTGIQVYDTSMVAKNTDGAYEVWYKPGPALGFTHNGTSFATVDSIGKITKYTDWTWTGASETAWIGTSLYDSKTAVDSPAGLLNPHTGQSAGQHETPVGGLTSFNMRRRAKMVVNVPALAGANNDDPDKYRVYWARQAAEPTAAQLKLAGTVGSPTSRSDLVITTDPIGVAPPGGIANTVSANNNFPLANPGKVMSTGKMSDGEPTIDLSGDGSGRVGPFAWTSNGSNANDTGWITLPLTNGWTNFGGAYGTPQYRRVSNQVFFRGLIRDGLDGVANPFATMPVGFRSPFDLICVGVVDEIVRGGITITSVGVRLNVTNDGKLSVGDTSYSGIWISLSSLSYFID